ncbi:hypothetical protein E2P81_ATG01133 [Venturia nashicola]|nr:hypothetical protein E2P81_ATG01133 [Venturia nashicola]
MTVAQFLQWPVIHSTAAEQARLHYEAFRSMGGHLRDLTDIVRQLHDTWIRVYNDALIYHMNPRDDINLGNMYARFHVVLNAIQAGAPIPPSCRMVIQQRAKEVAKREARKESAREIGRTADPFSMVFEPPAPTSGSASSSAAIAPGRRHIDGIYRRTPAFQEERQVEAALRNQAAEMKKAGKSKKAAGANATKNKQLGAAVPKRTEPAESERNTDRDEGVVGRPLDSIAGPSITSRPRTRARADNEAANGGDLSINKALPTEIQEDAELDQTGPPTQGHLPKSGFVRDLDLDEVEWIFDWKAKWDALPKGDHKKSRNAWLKDNPGETWSWSISGQVDFNEAHRVGEKAKKKKLRPTGMKNGFDENKLYFQKMLEMLKKNKADEEAEGAKAKASEKAKPSSRRRHGHGRLEAGNEVPKREAEGNAHQEMDEDDSDSPKIAEFGDEDEEMIDKPSSAGAGALQTASSPALKGVKFQPKEEAHAKSLVRKWNDMDPGSKKAFLKDWAAKHGDYLGGRKAEWWLWGKYEFNEKYPGTIIYDTRLKNDDERLWHIIKRKSSKAAARGADGYSKTQAVKAGSEKARNSLGKEVDGLEVDKPGRGLKRSRKAAEVEDSDENTPGDMVPTTRQTRLQAGAKRRRTTALAGHDADHAMSEVPGSMPGLIENPNQRVTITVKALL